MEIHGAAEEVEVSTGKGVTNRKGETVADPGQSGHFPQKPHLVLLHGFMGSGRNFEHLTGPMSRFCMPVTVDLLGHGRTEGSNDPNRFAAKRQVADLHQIIGNLEGSPWLYGYSMGGRLALQYALAHQERLRGVILESTHPGLESESDRQKRRELDEERAQRIQSDFPKFLEEWQRIPLFAAGSASPDLVKRQRSVQKSQHPEWMATSLRGFGTGSLPPALPRLDTLTLPVLLIAGEKDGKYCDLSGQMAPLLPQAEREIVSDAAHRVHLDRPDNLISRINTFITQHNRQS